MSAIAALGLLALALPPSVRAASAEESVAAELEATLHLKILSYDRNLKKRSGGKLVIGVLGRADDRGASGAAVATAFRELAKKVTVQEMKPAVVELTLDGSDLQERLRAQGVTVVYLAPGLEGSVAEIDEAARGVGAATLTGRRSGVDAGVAVAVIADGKKPKIVINLPVAKKLGMDLDPSLLKLAEVKK
jgi:hypothetical protein